MEIIATSPKKYFIKDIKKSLKNYIEQKQFELKNKEKNIEKIELDPKTYFYEKNPSSVTIKTGREEHLKAIIDLRSSAKKEILQLAPTFKGTFASRISIIRNLKRKVKYKIITSKIQSNNLKNIRATIENGGEVRVLNVNEKEMFSLVIIDNIQFLISLQDRKKEENQTSFISQNKTLLGDMKKIFNTYWEKAKPLTLKDLK